MARLLLVNTNTETKPYPVPPLGICLLANRLCEKYEVQVFDGTFCKGEGLAEQVRDFAPDYIGFSLRNIDDMTFDCLNYYVDGVLKDFVFPVKEISEAKLIIGGAGFSIFPREIMAASGADYGVVGAGEEVLPVLLEKLDRGETDIRLPGVIAKSKNGMIGLPPEFPAVNYFQPPAMVDRWLNFEPYRQRGAYPVQTRRGCSFNCVYCTYPGIEGRACRLRNPSDIVEEMHQAAGRLGDITFEFVDSIFNDPPGHAEAICREIVQRGLKFRMRTMGINPRHTNGELIDLMVEAGFAQVDCTPDSASERMLKNLGKNFSLDALKSTARTIRQKNLPAMWFFIFGGPGETSSTIDETFRFIDEFVCEEDMVHITSGLRIYPGTKLAAISLKEGLIASESELLRPRFYFSAHTPHQELSGMLREKCSVRSNCILSSESAPPPEMMACALKIRKEQNLSEPMFRTLMRLRAGQFNRGT